VFVAVLGVLLLLAHQQARGGWAWFVRQGDPVFFAAVARAPFGGGGAFRAMGVPFEASFRYGRVGFPLVAWALTLGRPSLVPAGLALVDLVSIAAVPALSVLLLDGYRANPLGGVATLAAPGLVLVYDRAYAEPFMLALVLLGFLCEARGRRGAAIAVFAGSILVKETAILALTPFVWQAARRRDWPTLGSWAAALVPYLAWATWVRVRVGEVPFLADDHSRRDALRLPFVGMVEALRDGHADAAIVTIILVTTVVVGVGAAWFARAIPIAGATLAFAVLTASAGPNTINYLGDALRILVVPQVLSIICIVWAVTSRTADMPNARAASPGPGGHRPAAPQAR